MLVMITAATTCMSSSVRIIKGGDPGIVSGVANDSTSTTAATMRKVRIGHRESKATIVKITAAPAVPIKEERTTGVTVIDPES